LIQAHVRRLIAMNAARHLRYLKDCLRSSPARTQKLAGEIKRMVSRRCYEKTLPAMYEQLCHLLQVWPKEVVTTATVAPSAGSLRRCRNFTKVEGCKWGAQCKFLHVGA
jgi:hypothetical protein